MTRRQCDAIFRFYCRGTDGMIYRGEFKIMSIGKGLYVLATYDAFTEIRNLYIDETHMHIITDNDDLKVAIQ